jgi:hypothetical protein
MGIILEFRRKEEAAADRTAKPVEGSLGEIIIFLGVRIERYRKVPSDMPEHAGQPSGRPAQRGRKKKASPNPTRAYSGSSGVSGGGAGSTMGGGAGLT